jgi:nucleoside-diphosphate-sugar epimerase
MSTEAHGNLAGKHLAIFGCGYLGTEVAREAVARQMRVTAVTRNVEKAAELRDLGVQVVLGNLGFGNWHDAVGRADLALNCVSSGGGGARAYRFSYLYGMQSVLAWAAAFGPVDTLVYTSSTSVYPHGGGVRVDESAPIAGRDERTAVLVATEALVRESSPRVGRSIILRLAGIYGPARTHLLNQVRTGEVAGTGSHHLNLIHRDDACGAIWASFGSGAPAGSSIFNVADDGAATKAEVTAWLAEKLGVPPPRFTGEPANGRTPVPDRIVLNAQLKTVLGWSPRWPDFRAGYENLLSR